MVKRFVDCIKRHFIDAFGLCLVHISRKRPENLFFYPHPNCMNDGYDIIHFHSDNVLCFVHHLLQYVHSRRFIVYIVVYDANLITQYQKYVNAYNSSVTVHFLDFQNKLQIAEAVARCKYCFTDTTYSPIMHRSRSQVIVCLNYFIPFKNDFMLPSKYRSERWAVNNRYDYFLTTAAIPARVAACDKGVSLDKFLQLGFCRNDVFYEQDFNVKKALELHLNCVVDKLIVYTPTYRDYEASSKECIIRDMFGYDDLDYDKLDDLLESYNAVILAKLHPKQTNISVSNHKLSRLVDYNDVKSLGYSLYQYLSQADSLITDYTSTYFDFLHRNRPVIFNFYDYDEYKADRGFGLSPIIPFCAGPIVSVSQDLLNAISDVLNGIDACYSQRQKIRPLFDDYYDGDNTIRNVRFFLNV